MRTMYGFGGSIGKTVGWLLTALASGAVGWALHAPDADPATVPAAARVGAAGRPAATATTATRPTVLQDGVQTAADGTTIAVAADGNVTLRVEQQPLDWVLEQLAQQSGRSDLRTLVRAAAAHPPAPSVSAAVVCPETPAVRPAEAAALLQAIQRGSEADRYQGLLQARSEGVAVPDETLKVLYETDGSDSVRLLAFENYLETRTGDTEVLHRVLESALNVPNAAIQREAKRRLDDLNEGLRIDSASPQAPGS